LVGLLEVAFVDAIGDDLRDDLTHHAVKVEKPLSEEILEGCLGFQQNRA
jgi:hypothetical protein